MDPDKEWHTFELSIYVKTTTGLMSTTTPGIYACTPAVPTDGNDIRSVETLQYATTSPRRVDGGRVEDLSGWHASSNSPGSSCTVNLTEAESPLGVSRG